MNAADLKENLQSKIEDTLIPLIDSDYVYWDLPYHINMGDTLIWQGTLDFLKKVPYKMLGFGSAQTVKFPKLQKNTIILLHGGGNFGDIYRSSQRFRNEVVKKYPENKIIILPQTIYYSNLQVLKNDMKIIGGHDNLYICVRDQSSQDLILPFFNLDKIKLLPDMAFCMDSSWFFKQNVIKNHILYMKRVDNELSNKYDFVNFNYNLKSDWPSFENDNRITSKLKKYITSQLIINRINNIIPLDLSFSLSEKIDSYCNSILRPHLLESAIQFLEPFEKVYTTRMHGCILSIMMNKQIILLDNSYGKNINFYQAWLSEYDKIEVIEKQS